MPRFVPVFVVAFLLACSLGAKILPADEAVIWLETETFEHKGGWVNDAQFVDQMGSPFLLAIGLEGPVEDAVTTVKVPQAGRYCLWVRNRDWLPEYSPGRFQIVVGDQVIPHIFGANKKGQWIWEDGGEIDLPAGSVTVRLRDLTGHYARCDVIVLAADPAFRPADDLGKLARQREIFGGVSREIKTLEPYDTVVVGGGLAGTFAAVASARMGCRTALIQNRPVLGGNASTEILVNPEGDTTGEPLDPGEGGIIEEVRGDVFGYSKRLQNLVESQPNLDVFLNTHATGVEMESASRIKSVIGLNVNTGERMRFPGRIFIDCTGDGSIGVWAGAEYRHGREPRSLYNESRAPEVEDVNTGTMGGTLRYMTEQMAEPVAFHAPDWAHKFDDCADFNPGRHPQLRFGGWQWVIEYGGVLDTYRDAEIIRDELLRIIWGMWDHAKNHCPKLEEEAANFKLTWVSHVVGKRESRRLMGDHIMTEHDIARQTLFPDRVAYGGWGIDIHPPKGFYDPGPAAEFSHKLKFSIPFRSLYSKNVENLMMAGRCISVTHVALGATRVMITCGVQGQAVGTAAGFCKRYNTTPRGVSQEHIAELQQQLLKDGCYIIDLPNQDPRDLARTARVSASSVAPNDVYKVAALLPAHKLDHDRAVMFRWPGGRLESIALHLSSEAPQAVPLTAVLCAATGLTDYENARELARARVVVPPGFSGWVTAEIHKDLAAGYYFIWLPRTAGLTWTLYSQQVSETSRAYRSPGAGWTNMPQTYAFRLSPGNLPEARLAIETAEQQPLFAPENVIDGYARAVRGIPHSWRPHPEKPLPQWIELDFGKPVTFNSVHVSFQSKALRADDFDLQVWREGQWHPVAEVRDNFDRRRVLNIEETTSDRLRIVILRAQPEMGICEIRVYREGEP